MSSEFVFTDDINLDSLWPQSENTYVSNKFFFILYALFHKWKFKSQDGKRERGIYSCV